MRAETSVVETAHRIRDEERAMIERLEDGFDRAVNASLRGVEADELDEQLREYLADAHAIEEQAIAAFEHLEIGGYEQLKLVAARVGDGTTVQTVEQILAQEREAAGRLAGAFDEAATAALASEGVV